jgi:GntR family transcriptional regulator
MFFTIDPNNGLAIYDQIMRQVKFAVASGGLQAGQRVPSLQELSAQLALNPNTVARAYRELQAEGILEMVRGVGLEISSKAVKRCQQERDELIRERLRSVLAEARQSQFDDAELRSMFNEELAALSETTRGAASKNRKR